MSNKRERIIPIEIEGEPSGDSPKTFRNKNTESNPTTSEPAEIQQSKINSKEINKDSIEQLILPVQMPKQVLPSHNVSEKIILAIDKSQDENCSDFVVSGKQFAPFTMLKKAIEIFLYNKNAINSSHQFALMELNENSVEWLHDFTSVPQDIVTSINNLRECETEDIFNLNPIFDMINRKIALNVAKNDLEHIPNFVVRLIIIYGRSYTMPKLEKTDEIEALLKSPYFTVDVVMTHEPPSSANHCDAIFQALQNLDEKGFSYSFAVGRNCSDLYKAMAKLLSHPLQRPPQNFANYSLEKCTEV